MATAFPTKLSTPLRHLFHRYPAASTTVPLSSKLTSDTFPVFLAPQSKPDVNGFITAEHLKSLGRIDSPVVMTTQSLAQQAVVELARQRVVNSDDDEDDDIGSASGDDEFDDVFDDDLDDDEFDDDDEDDDDDDDDDEKPRRRSV